MPSTSPAIEALRSRLRRFRSTRQQAALQAIKCRVIDAVFARPDVHSVADLGGVWNVEGGYTFYALERHRPTRAVLVDEEVTERVRRKAAAYPQLELIEATFGEAEIVARVGKVDALLLFDVLLHQVAPDWDEILNLYGPQVRYVAIANPQYVGAPDSVRLIDLGADQYLATVPPQENHETLFTHLDEVDPRRGRPYRDVPEVWQWGIVDADLRGRMSTLGFELAMFENGGPWAYDHYGRQGKLTHFEQHTFLFARRDS